MKSIASKKLKDVKEKQKEVIATSNIPRGKLYGSG
tara:strand:- start:21 stop:125 length:105 start_codon:yes stop_codon:yes gene_type:complete